MIYRYHIPYITTTSWCIITLLCMGIPHTVHSGIKRRMARAIEENKIHEFKALLCLRKCIPNTEVNPHITGRKYQLLFDWQSSLQNPTLLHLAAFYGRREIAQMLLESGAIVDAKLKEMTGGNATPLHIATLQKQKYLVELLCNWGANIQICADDQSACGSALSLAITCDWLQRSGENTALCADLLQYILHQAHQRLSPSEKQALIDNRADYTGVRLGPAPLEIASAGHYAAAHMLLCHNASPTFDNRFTVLHRSKPSENATNDELQRFNGVIQHAIRKGVNISAPRNIFDERTERLDDSIPISLAAILDHRQKLQTLLTHGGDVNVLDNDGNRPIDVAASESIKTILLQYGARHTQTQHAETEDVKLLIGQELWQRLHEVLADQPEQHNNALRHAINLYAHYVTRDDHDIAYRTSLREFIYQHRDTADSTPIIDNMLRDDQAPAQPLAYAWNIFPKTCSAMMTPRYAAKYFAPYPYYNVLCGFILQDFLQKQRNAKTTNPVRSAYYHGNTEFVQTWNRNIKKAAVMLDDGTLLQHCYCGPNTTNTHRSHAQQRSNGAILPYDCVTEIMSYLADNPYPSN